MKAIRITNLPPRYFCGYGEVYYPVDVPVEHVIQTCRKGISHFTGFVEDEAEVRAKIARGEGAILTPTGHGLSNRMGAGALFHAKEIQFVEVPTLILVAWGSNGAASWRHEIGPIGSMSYEQCLSIQGKVLPEWAKESHPQVRRVLFRPGGGHR